jgi:two-component system phosphate regulon sensor histidine kinase PhoR
MAWRNWDHLQSWSGVVVGGLAEVGLMLPGGWQEHYPGVPTAAGILVAVAAAAVAGPWGGLAVATGGWTLFFTAVADGAARAVLSLPAWLAAALIAGLAADWFRRERRDRVARQAELAAVRAAGSDALIGIDADRSVATWSAGAEAVYGYSEDEAIGRPVATLLGDERAAQELGEMLALTDGGAPVAGRESVHRRADGEEITVTEAAYPVPDGVLLVASDVSVSARARDELRKAESRYRGLVEHLPLTTYAHSVGDRSSLIYMSAQIEDLLGYSADEVRERPQLLEALLHPDDRERVLGELDETRKDGRSFRSEYRMLSRDGRVVWVRDEATTVRDAEGRPLYVQGTLADAGERRRGAEERERVRAAERAAIADSNKRQQRLDFLSTAGEILASSFDYEVTLRRVAALAVHDFADWLAVDVREEDGTVHRVAVACSEPSPVVGEPASTPEDAVLRVIGSGDVDHTSEPLPVVRVPLRARGRPFGAFTFVRAEPGTDFSEDEIVLARDLARRAAIAIDSARLYREVEERAEAAQVLTHVGDAVFLVDRAGVIRLWNPAAEAITGLSSTAVIGHPASDAIPGWQAIVERTPVATSREPKPTETVPIETERGERWISISAVEFFGGIVYAFRDLTEEHHLEELRTEFVATASHELRTPLAAVYGAAQTLRRHDFALDEAGRDRFVSLIVDESERLSRIVNEILLATQLDARVVEFAGESFDGADVVERVVESARLHAPPSVTLEVIAPSRAALVAGDRDKVRQVLVNLVENAIKYSPDGGHVEVGVEPVEDEEVVRFHVRDEGLGIPADQQGRIFEKFFRLDPGMARGVGGTGLGLYICSELVERMGGRIWVESNEGRGSTFFCELPLAGSRSWPLGADAPEPSPTRGTA